MEQIEYSPSTDKFGKAVVKYFRDEIFQNFIDEKVLFGKLGKNQVSK